MFKKWNKLRLFGKQKLWKLNSEKKIVKMEKKNFKEAVYLISIFLTIFFI